MPDQATIQDFESYLKRLDDVNAAVKSLMDDARESMSNIDVAREKELRRKQKKEKKKAPPEPEKPKPTNKHQYSSDYSRWAKMDENADEQPPKEKETTAKPPADDEDSSDEDLTEKVCRQEAAKAKELANDHFKKNEYERAYELYTRSCTLDDTQVVYFLNRAMTAIKLEKWDEGIADCETVLRMEPKNQKAIFRKALIHFHTNKFEEASQGFQLCCQLDKKNAEFQRWAKTAQVELTEFSKTNDATPEVKTRMEKLDSVLKKFGVCVKQLQYKDTEKRETHQPEANEGDDDEDTIPPDELLPTLLAVMAIVPPLLSDEACQIFFRFKGGLEHLFQLLHFISEHRTTHLTGTTSTDRVWPLLVEGCCTLLAFVVPNEWNLEKIVTKEKEWCTKNVTKQAEETTEQKQSLLQFVLWCITESDNKNMSQAAMHALSALTAHEWVRDELLQQVTASSITVFPSHNNSGHSLAYIAQIVDNCLRSPKWGEEFKKIDLTHFLTSYINTDYTFLQKHIAGALLRLTTDCYQRKQLMRKTDDVYQNLAPVVTAFHSGLSFRGNGVYACSDSYTTEAILGVFHNCMTLLPTVEERTPLCKYFMDEKLCFRWVGLLKGDADPSVASRATQCLCRIASIESLWSAVLGEYEDCIDVLISTISNIIKQDDKVFIVDKRIDETKGADDRILAYKESTIESCVTILAHCNKPLTVKDTIVDVPSQLFSHWVTMASLLPHPNNNISGNVALLLNHIATTDERIAALGNHKLDLIKMLLDCIIDRRDQTYKEHAHSKNTAENNHSVQKNCAVTLAKLARNQRNRERLSELKGFEVLHAVQSMKK